MEQPKTHWKPSLTPTKEKSWFGSSSKVTVSIGNLDRAIQLLVEENDLVGRRVRQIQWFNNTASTLQFYWIISNVKANEKVAKFELGTNVDLLTAKLPNRILNAAFCSWQFKGVECKYAGSDTECEKSWEDCCDKGNTVNFGGAPGLVNQHFYF
jgi:lambda family phage minor tail protein L